MLVLKHNSPPVSPRWPMAVPRTTVPSASASFAGAGERSGDESAVSVVMAWRYSHVEERTGTPKTATKKPPLPKRKGRKQHPLANGLVQGPNPQYKTQVLNTG